MFSPYDAYQDETRKVFLHPEKSSWVLDHVFPSCTLLSTQALRIQHVSTETASRAQTLSSTLRAFVVLFLQLESSVHLHCPLPVWQTIGHLQFKGHLPSEAIPLLPGAGITKCSHAPASVPSPSHSSV